MLELLKSARSLVENYAKIKAGERVLVLTDDEACPMQLGKLVMDVAGSMGAEVALLTMKSKEMPGYEPPAAVAAAMKSVNTLFMIFGGVGIEHTNARKEATAAGVRIYCMAEVPHDRFQHQVTSADLEQIKERTERLAQKLTRARHARVTTPSGTNLVMTLDGRNGLGIHPLWGEGLGTIPDYAEAAIAPVEGSAEGTMVIDVWVSGWGYPLKEPIRCVVKSGRVMEIRGDEDAERYRRLVASDENASNIAELGIGTSHTIERKYLTTRIGGGTAGYVHIAIGRNNDIGGQTWSRVHVDGLLSRPTVVLDEETVVKDGALL